MTTEEFTAAVISRVLAWRDADRPGLPVITENAPVPDENTIGMMWIDLEMRWYGGKNISMGAIPLGRHTGAASVNVFYREREGTGVAGAVTDQLINLLKNVRFGAGRLEFPQKVVPTSIRGWYKTGVLVPFYLDAS
jgi:hypothetical protein